LLIRAIAKTLVLPPAISLLFAVVAFVVWRRFPRLARGSLLLSIASLWLFSLPVTSSLLMSYLEHQHAPWSENAMPSSANVALVVLGGGRRLSAVEYGGEDSVNARTLQRLRYGAYLQKQTQLPLLVSGGRVFGDESISEAQLMARVLRNEFGVPVRWLEVNSRTTAENASYTAELLRAEGIESIVLVTHAWHMPRAVWVFEQTGLSVTPAPMGQGKGKRFSLRQWVPSAVAMLNSYYALHEMLGDWAYRIGVGGAAPHPTLGSG
tara:strand:- start:3041 stop:3835 length:795 start_codon:yes stop_codon:yes gene_type:complete